MPGDPGEEFLEVGIGLGACRERAVDERVAEDAPWVCERGGEERPIGAGVAAENSNERRAELRGSLDRREVSAGERDVNRVRQTREEAIAVPRVGRRSVLGGGDDEGGTCNVGRRSSNVMSRIAAPQAE